MESTVKQLARRLVEHLQGDGCYNDMDTDALYREAHRVPEDEDTDGDIVGRWAVETAQDALIRHPEWSIL